MCGVCVREAQNAVHISLIRGREEDEEHGVVCDFEVEDGGFVGEREGGDRVAVEVAWQGGYGWGVGEVVGL